MDVDGCTVRAIFIGRTIVQRIQNEVRKVALAMTENLEWRNGRDRHRPQPDKSIDDSKFYRGVLHGAQIFDPEIYKYVHVGCCQYYYLAGCSSHTNIEHETELELHSNIYFFFNFVIFGSSAFAFSGDIYIILLVSEPYVERIDHFIY